VRDAAGKGGVMSDMALLVPPHSAMAESSVIGGLMLDYKSAWPAVSALLRTEDFYLRQHQILFHAIGWLIKNERPVDVITVHDRICEKGHEEAVGGLAYLGMLAKDTPSAANVGTYAQIVRDKATLRRVIELSGQLREMATAKDADAKKTVAAAEKLVFEMAQRDLRSKKGFSPLREIMRGVIDQIEANFEKPAAGVLGISSGFAELDAYTSGLNGGDLVVVAARPSMGKTTFAMNLAETAAVAGKVVAVFSLEMPMEQLGQRMLASAAGVGLKRIREAWTLQDSDWPRFTTGMTKLNDLPMYIDDSAGLTAGEVRSRCMKLNIEIREDHPDGIGMIVIDYLQLMGADQERAGNRNNEIEDMTRNLKRLAKELGIPVVVLSQLNRNLESRPNKRPLMSDLRDSGGIEQDADMILFLYRDEVYNKESPDAGIAEVIIGKQRNGPLGTVRLQFDGGCTRFRSLDNAYDYESSGGGWHADSAR
jgi:replicative DNA helicase